MSDRVILLRDASGEEHRVTLAEDGTVIIAGEQLTVRSAPDGSAHVTGAGAAARAWTVSSAGATWVFLDGHAYTFEFQRPGTGRRRSGVHAGSHSAPMPATVRTLEVAVGDVVRRGDLLIVLEAMKMELPVRAGVDGRVKAIHCREGELVQPGNDLVVLEE